ncbi:MAG: hypothetical protein E7617_00045 [Ruminococcaceae bacterium]|nr:hypothetical protein [Oscillospiraceae bacterium]
MGLTRSSFKKKIIVFGVAVFTALALTATGFATWVLSTSVSKNAGGNVNVGITNEAKIGISEVTYVDNKKEIHFEPLADDSTGRVRWDGENSENLAVEFFVELTNLDVVATITIDSIIPDGVLAAETAGYIKIPAWVKSQVLIVNGMNSSDHSLDDGWSYKVEDRDTGGGSTVKVGVLTCRLEFEWGEKFNGLNPSEYYDEDAAGKAVSSENVKRELDTLRATVCGVSYDEYIANPTEYTAPEYTITITASP